MNILDSYADILNETEKSTKGSSDEELEYNLIFKSKKRAIHWKVTEDGLVYCSKNCLIASKSHTRHNKSKFDTSSTYSSSFIKANPFYFYNKSYLAQYETKSTTHDQSVISSDTETVKILNEDAIELLVCSPYANQTNYDFLRSLSKRNKLVGVPEPELITMFDRSSIIDLKKVREQLIKMKNEVNKFYKQNLRAILNH